MPLFETNLVLGLGDGKVTLGLGDFLQGITRGVEGGQEDDDEPEVITRQWVIWHLIEHDLHHGGEISITLGAHGVQALEL